MVNNSVLMLEARAERKARQEALIAEKRYSSRLATSGCLRIHFENQFKFTTRLSIP